MAPNDTRAFKVGDRVRSVVALGDLAAGALGSITRLSPDFAPWFTVKVDGEKEEEWLFYEREMEHVDPPSDAVSSPAHYARFTIQPATFITANDLPFLTGNALKYLVRAPYKGQEIEDYRKAIRSIEMLIEAAVRREAVAHGQSASDVWSKAL